MSWHKTPYGLAYAQDHSGLRKVYQARGYPVVPDHEVVGLQHADPDEHTADQLTPGDVDELRDAIRNELPGHEQPQDSED